MEKLTQVQLQFLRSFLEYTYDQVKEELLKKYSVARVEDLNSTNFDDIVDDAVEWHNELNEQHKG